jgi:asparagine synthase (glutamine-hydrolysing)
MCGIAGYWNENKDLSSIKDMLAQIKHRGPDDQGVWIDSQRGVVLGQQRLSIQPGINL